MGLDAQCEAALAIAIAFPKRRKGAPRKHGVLPFSGCAKIDRCLRKIL